MCGRWLGCWAWRATCGQPVSWVKARRLPTSTAPLPHSSEVRCRLTASTVPVWSPSTAKRAAHDELRHRTAVPVAHLNDVLRLGLTARELRELMEQQTVANCSRFGMMAWNSRAVANVEDGTVFNSAKAAFAVQGSSAEINADGSLGARVNPANGIILQVMDKDEASSRRDAPTGRIHYDTYYSEPFDAYPDLARNPAHDVTATGAAEIIGNFHNIDLQGSFLQRRDRHCPARQEKLQCRRPFAGGRSHQSALCCHQQRGDRYTGSGFQVGRDGSFVPDAAGVGQRWRDRGSGRQDGGHDGRRSADSGGRPFTIPFTRNKMPCRSGAAWTGIASPQGRQEGVEGDDGRP